MGQSLTQRIAGVVTDAQTGRPLIQASVTVERVSSVTTGEDGDYQLDVVPGRYKIIFTYVGYATRIDEILVISGRQTILNASLAPAENLLEGIEIQSTTGTTMPGLNSLSIEKTLRIPANYFDPVRAYTAYPGVIATSDQNNSIIVRGNSPNGLLWRLNGLDIVNPNHLANAGTFSDRPAANGGGVNILSAQLLDQTDFYAGAIPTRYGNVLSGVVDMSLRDGNKNRDEYTAQASLLGLDLSAEGPLDSGRNISYLANYRYSTVGLLSALGVDFGDEQIGFQDLSFTIHASLRPGEQLSLFGFGGASANRFEAKPPDEWEVDKDRYNIDYNALTFGGGINYIRTATSGKLFIGAAYSSSDQSRLSTLQNPPAFELNVPSEDLDWRHNLLSTRVEYDFIIPGKNVLQLGIMTNYQNDQFYSSRESGCRPCEFITTETLTGTGEGLLLQPHLAWSAYISEELQLNTGVRYVYYTYNDAQSIEPRLGLTWAVSPLSSVGVAYSLVSQVQLPQVYFRDGNENLGFTKSHHLDASFSQSFKNDVIFKSNIYYQRLFDIPVTSVPSAFSAINLLEELPPGELINAGTASNYGINLTIEKFFFNKTYVLAGGSYYESKYKGSDGVERDTRFNGNYTLNAVYGREWSSTSRNRVIGLNLRSLWLGGLRMSRILEQSATSPETVYDVNDPFTEKLSDYFRIDLRLSHRKNHPGHTRTIALDIQNVANLQNEAWQYYDKTQSKNVTQYQLGIIPVLVYRIDF